MTFEIALVLSFLVVSIVLLVTERIPMEVTALLTLGALAVSGMLTPSEALSGFSNPAVVTVWAIFILSGSLTRVGVANVIGQHVLRFAGHRELLLTAAIMVTAGVLSAFMNNVAIAALMLPVVMDISRQTNFARSRLLMPLAYGSLLGGLTTLIGTPPNILVSDALRDNGLPAFGLFDYTPAGIAVMVAGIAFILFLGRYLLPRNNVHTDTGKDKRPDFRQRYDLENRIFLQHLDKDSTLVGKSLEQIRIRSLLGLNVIAIVRRGDRIPAPPPSESLQAFDLLLIESQIDRVKEIAYWGRLEKVDRDAVVENLVSPDVTVFEAKLAENSSLADKTIGEIGFPGRFGAKVLAARTGSDIKVSALGDQTLEPETILLLQGNKELPAALNKESDFDQIREVPPKDLYDTYRLHERLITVRVPDDPVCADRTVRFMRLAEALDIRIPAVVRRGDAMPMPAPEDEIRIGDLIVLLGSLENLEILRAMSALKPMENASPSTLPELESELVGFMEAILSPHTTLTGKTLRQLRFREKYDLTVLSIWRGGKAIRTGLRDVPLHFGDALLMHGKRKKYSLLGRDPDFVVLTETAQDVPRTKKIWVSLAIFAGVLVSVLLGLVPIHIAAVIGAALVVVTGCLTMEEAYRFIEWKAVFLIAGMLPLGLALDKTGAARFLAEGVVSLVGPFGPLAVMAGIVALTFLATCFVPTAALVVIMAPIVLNTSADMSVSPHALMMAMALAASSSFMTPVSHPANILIMGPGGYRFFDYIKLGLPLTLVVFIVIILVVPFFWPLGL